MDMKTPTFRLRDVAKNPLSYALMILGMLVGTLFYAYIGSNKHDQGRCELENARLWIQHDSDQQRLNRITKELEVANGVFTILMPIVDSLAFKKIKNGTH